MQYGVVNSTALFVVTCYLALPCLRQCSVCLPSELAGAVCTTPDTKC
jgi:hypothetical protein